MLGNETLEIEIPLLVTLRDNLLAMTCETCTETTVINTYTYWYN